MKEIIVAVDGSEHSMRAVEKAKEIGKAFDSHITLVHIVEALHIYNIESEAMVMEELKGVEDAKNRAVVLLANAKEVLKEFGDMVETVILEGDPPHEFINYIDESDADLVVIGSHGVKGLRRFMLGSMVSKVVHHVDRSVMIVR